MLSLMKSEELWKKNEMTKGHDLMVMNLETLARPVCSDSSRCPCVLRDKDVHFL